MKQRIFLRAFAGYVALSMLAVLVFAFYTVQVARGISLDSLTRGLESAARTALVSVAPLIGQGRSAALDGLTAAVGREGRVRLTVINPGESCSLIHSRIRRPWRITPIDPRLPSRSKERWELPRASAGPYDDG